VSGLQLACPHCDAPVPNPTAQLRELTYPCPDCGEWCLREELKCNPQLAIWMAGGGAPDLNIAEVNALIDARLYDTAFYHRKFRYDLQVPAGSTIPGFRSASYIDKALGIVRYVDLPAGTNKIFEICEKLLVDPFNVWALPFSYKMLQNQGNNVGTQAGESLQGIQWGSFSQNPPWQTNYASASTGSVIQLRFNSTSQKWEVLVWDTDTGTPPDVVECTLQPSFQVDYHLVELRMDYTPVVGGGSTLKAYLNGQLAHTYSGTRLDNVLLAGNNDGFAAGYFVTQGTSGARSEAGFYDNAIYQPLPAMVNSF